jgi:CRP-like cAMP-binding protein
MKITSLSEEEAEALSSQVESVCLNEDDYFLEAGMPVRKIGFVASGIFRRFIIDENGNELIQQFITEDQFFTDLYGYYEQKPSGTYIQAISPCRIFIISISELEILEEKIPRLKLSLARIREHDLLERIRMEDMLRMGTAADQYNYLVDHFPHLIQQVSLKHIASYLRITPQSLSRIRRQRS